MYPITADERALYAAENRQTLSVSGTDGNGNPIAITDADVMMGGFEIDRYCCNGKKLEIGTAVASEMTLKLDNRNGQFNGVAFEGVELAPEIGIADWNGIAAAKNMLIGTMDSVASPAAERIHIRGQTSNTSPASGITYTAAEHGLTATKTSGSATRPYVTFGTTVLANGTMNGLSAGQSYTISFDYTAKLYSGYTGTSALYFRVYLYTAGDDDTAWVLSQFGSIITYTASAANYGEEISGSFEWIFTVPEGATKLYMPVACNNATVSYSNIGDYFELRNMMLVEGDTASAWTPAPEDYTVYSQPCGVYIVDEQPRNMSTITLKALDRMTLFDREATANALTFPCTVQSLVSQCCSICGVTLAESIGTLPNATYSISAFPETTQAITYRTLIQCAAGAMGTNAYMDWNGQLRFGWYDGTTGYISTTANRFTSDMYEDDITVTGYQYRGAEDTVYLAGTNDYAIDMSGNLLFNSSNAATLLNAIYTARQGFTYRPFSAGALNAPYLWPMDRVSFVDANGDAHISALTNVNLKLNGSTALQAVGETEASNSLASPGSFTPQQAQTLARLQVVTDSRMEAAVQSATAQITGANGGYVRFIYDNNNKLSEILIMDTESVTTATKVWRWNSGGLGYSSNGYAGPYTLAMTQNGAIVADFITTGTLDGTKINAKLLSIVDANGNVIASFSDTIVLGKSGQARAEFDFNSFEIIDSSGNTVAVIGDMRDANGLATRTEAFTGDGITNIFNTQTSIVSIDSLKLNGIDVSSSDYSYGSKWIQFNTAPRYGANIVLTYQTDSAVYRYDIGNRKANTYIGLGSVAEGRNTTASGAWSHVEGENTTASGTDSHAEGYLTTASGLQSHAEGYYTAASGDYSHAEGLGTIASGTFSHAEGQGTAADGAWSHVEGQETFASSQNQHVFGKLNVKDKVGTYVEIVGNGTDESNRSNARTLDWAGNEYLAGALDVGDPDTTIENLGLNTRLIYYGTSGTAAATQEKAATVSGVTALFTGLQVRIRFTNGQTYNGQPTLNVNSLGAVNITLRGTTVGYRYMWTGGEIVDFVYDGTNFVAVDGALASTTYYGVTKLSSSTSSTSTALAATPSAVKAAYDLANSAKALTKVVSGTTDSDGNLSLALDGTRYAVISAVIPKNDAIVNVFADSNGALKANCYSPTVADYCKNETLSIWVVYLDLGAGTFTPN